jgi:trans-AT polyketide synthase, acyltransferase and oxidoreductase domains
VFSGRGGFSDLTGGGAAANSGPKHNEFFLAGPERLGSVSVPMQYSVSPRESGQLPGPAGFSAESLGDEEFRSDHQVLLAYVAGSMFKGIASEDMVLRMGKARLLGYFGTGGLKLERIESAIRRFQTELPRGQSYGCNLLCNLIAPDFEEATVRLYLRQGVARVEASAYTELTPWLVLYRVKGIRLDQRGNPLCANRILAKISHPEVARAFLAPPPAKFLQRLVETRDLTPEEAKLAERVPMAEDVCVEADSGGHTDQGVAYVLMPVMTALRDECMQRYRFSKRIRIGAAGGLGTPEAVAAAFILGADFVLTGSINQCTVEAGTSDLVKDILAEAKVQDTDMAPAGDMFEIGARVQVLKRGGFFVARANRLYELYRQHNSLEEISPSIREQIQKNYFKRTFEEVWTETRAFYEKAAPEQLRMAERSPKHKMALIFRWYFVQSHRLAQRGVAEGKVDFQIQCGPALGAFNEWVKGTALEDWKKRHVDEMGWLLMRGAARYLEERMERLRSAGRNRAAENFCGGNGEIREKSFV